MEIAVLKDSIVELENANATLVDKLKLAREEIEQLKIQKGIRAEDKRPSKTSTGRFSYVKISVFS